MSAGSEDDRRRPTGGIVRPPTAASPAAAQRESPALPLALLAAITPVLVLTGPFCKAGRLKWLLEVAPSCSDTWRWRDLPAVRLTHFGYVSVLHSLILVYGGYYTYGLEWAADPSIRIPAGRTVRTLRRR